MALKKTTSRTIQNDSSRLSLIPKVHNQGIGVRFGSVSMAALSGSKAACPRYSAFAFSCYSSFIVSIWPKTKVNVTDRVAEGPQKV